MNISHTSWAYNSHAKKLFTDVFPLFLRPRGYIYWQCWKQQRIPLFIALEGDFSRIFLEPAGIYYLPTTQKYVDGTVHTERRVSVYGKLSREILPRPHQFRMYVWTHAITLYLVQKSCTIFFYEAPSSNARLYIYQ